MHTAAIAVPGATLYDLHFLNNVQESKLSATQALEIPSADSRDTKVWMATCVEAQESSPLQTCLLQTPLRHTEWMNTG